MNKSILLALEDLVGEKLFDLVPLESLVSRLLA